MKFYEMERLTEEKQIGPFASLKDKAESKIGAFNDYDCLYAHMLAVTRLKNYEDMNACGRMIILPEDVTVKDLLARIDEKEKEAEDAQNQPSPSFVTGYTTGVHKGVADMLRKILEEYIAK